MTTVDRRDARGPLARLLLMLLLAGVLVGIDALLFRHFDKGSLFWDWFRPRPRVPAMLFMGAVSAAILGAALLWRGGAPAGRTSLITGVALSIVLIGIVGAIALMNFPNSGDEYAYYFQALTFEAGRLWNPAPAQGRVVAASFTWVAQGRWVGQYPPVWPALIAIIDSIGLPVWALNALLLIPASLLLYTLIAREASSRAAGLAVATFALAPFTVFQAASYFSHFFAGALTILIAWAYRRGTLTDRWALIALAGAGLGLLANTRSSSVLVVAIPLGAALLLARRWTHLIAFCLAGIPFGLLILAYQHAITGDMFTPVYYFGGRRLDHLYFDLVSIKEGSKSTIGKLSELSIWVCPLLVPVWLCALALKVKNRTVSAIDAIFPMALLLFVFYPLDPGNRYGPRYYYEFWPLMLYTIATGARFVPTRIRQYLVPLAFGSIAYGFALLPFLGAQYHAIILQRTDPYRQIAAQHLRHAVVCMDYSFGLLPLGGTDYARNGIDANKPLIYADCTHRKAAEIRRLFPGYPLYYYYYPRDRRYGRLLKLSD